MKKLAIISSVLALLALLGCAFLLGKREKGNLGASQIIASTYSQFLSSTSSSIPAQVATTSNPILSADITRKDAEVCYAAGTSTIWLHARASSTTSGVLVGTGVPLFPTSSVSGNSCRNFPGLVGFLFGVSLNPASTTQVQIR